MQRTENCKMKMLCKWKRDRAKRMRKMNGGNNWLLNINLIMSSVKICSLLLHVDKYLNFNHFSFENLRNALHIFSLPVYLKWCKHICLQSFFYLTDFYNSLLSHLYVYYSVVCCMKFRLFRDPFKLTFFGCHLNEINIVKAINFYHAGRFS